MLNSMAACWRARMVARKSRPVTARDKAVTGIVGGDPGTYVWTAQSNPRREGDLQ